ncbi:MAG: AAA family ATPase [Firmicutes bacterium]|nr:AAA family ATPase [Bacillota bacterium]
MSYFPELNLFSKILAILLAIVLIAIPILIVVIIVRRIILNIKLRATTEDNAELYKEIGKLNKQVLDLIDEKNRILALQVKATGANNYIGESALATDTIGGTVNGNIVASGLNFDEKSAESMATATVNAKMLADQREKDSVIRFPKLYNVDERYAEYVEPEWDNEITLEQFCEKFRQFAGNRMKLYYSIETIRRFVAGMASSHIMILEGISGTGKTSLPYSLSRFLNNPATIVSVQPNFRDRTEILGYFNEFSKRFNETEFLRAVYEANYRKDPCFIVLDEMNLARIEYYFAEPLSILEMPSFDEWVLDLVPTAWTNDPKLMTDGKVRMTPNLYFVGTANNDDSTFTITDKVYDRAMPIELNERAEPFEAQDQGQISITNAHLVEMFDKAKELYKVSDEMMDKIYKLDGYLQTRFKLSIGNRIFKQLNDFIPVYVATGGSELDAVDYILSRKVLKKFESLNIGFVRDEIKGLISYIEKLFGKTGMTDSKNYLIRIQNTF